MIQPVQDAVEPISTPFGTIEHRPEAAADEPFLFTLFENVKTPMFSMLPVGTAVRQQLAAMQFRAMTGGYAAEYPAARRSIVTLDGLPVGRTICDETAATFCIVYIALAQEWHNKGLATALMTAVLKRPRRLGLICEATAALDNGPSLRLWTKLGFTERSRNMTDVIMEWCPA